MSVAHQHNLPAAASLGRLGWARRHAAALLGAALFGLALALRLYRLGAQSLWLDEGGTWAEITSKSWTTLLAELASRDAAYPLYHLLLKGWVALVGDSEWALRCPSALAGALAVVALFLAAREHGRLAGYPAALVAPLAAGLLLATAPFALWYAQDAKAYSLLILVGALLQWALPRVLRLGTRRAWLTMLLLALLSVFVHRLALLALAGAALACTLCLWPTRPSQRHWLLGLAAAGLGLALVGVAGTIAVVQHERQGGSGHQDAGPLLGLWLSLSHFAVDRGTIAGMWQLPLGLWQLPALLLTLWGLLLLLRDARRGQPAAIITLCMLLVPLGAFALALAFAPLYEARYTTMAFPAWLLALVYPLWTVEAKVAPAQPRVAALRAVSRLLYGLLIVVNAAVLWQPQHGLFSGAPIKEQWREGVAYLAGRVHPDDLVILHPYYVWPLWRYYAPRVTPDPLPQPVLFTNFAEGDCAARLGAAPAQVRVCVQRSYEPFFNQQAAGKQRMLLLIAPDHARTVDPPKTLAELLAEHHAGDPLPTQSDRFGWVGLRFEYPQRTWPCGGTGAALIGVELMCQSFPETYNASGPGSIPQPTVPLSATFGSELQLRGYSLDLLGGQARPGGSLPVTLYWQAVAQPSRDYTMFLHLCRDCTAPPLANDDAPPLCGHGEAGRTTTWRLGGPVHDERALALPPDLAPGRYTLLLGVYPADNPDQAARLPVVSAAPTPGGTRLTLGQVEISQPSRPAPPLLANVTRCQP